MNAVGLAALVGIYATLVFDVFSSTNSSPQTTELFAADRAESLWRWVKIGAVISIVFIALGVWMEWKDKSSDKRSWLAPLVGGTVALVLMVGMYSHALKEGGGKRPGTSQGYSGGYW